MARLARRPKQPLAFRQQTLARGSEQVNLARDWTTVKTKHSTHTAVALRTVSSSSTIIIITIMKTHPNFMEQKV